MSYPQDNTIRYYPLNSIVGSGGAPRYAMYEPPDRNVIIESDRLTPLSAGDITFAPREGGTAAIPSNVESPGLPFYLRNSLLDLDSYQALEREGEKALELEALQQQLATMASENQRKAEQEAREEIRLKKNLIWQIVTVLGIGLVATAMSIWIFTK